MARPNILFLIADDHRHDAIHGFGDKVVQTPNLDELANAGTSMMNAHIMGSTSRAVCLPSRAMLLAGVGLFNVFASPDDDREPYWRDYTRYKIDGRYKLFPELLADAGYSTYGIGKWHNRPSEYARSFTNGGSIFLGGGFDQAKPTPNTKSSGLGFSHEATPVWEFQPTGNYEPDQVARGKSWSSTLFTDTAIGLLRSHSVDDPFCMYIAFTEPHDPRTPPEEFASMYAHTEIPLPDNFLPQHPFDNGELHVRDEELAPHPRTADDIRQHIADYYGMISKLDSEIGRLMQALQDLNLVDNTIVVYVADHGLALGQHGLLGKQNLYSHSVRVPMILRGPGIPSGKRHDALCYLHDMYATLLDYAEVDIPAQSDSISLLPVLNGEVSDHRETIFSAYQMDLLVESDGPYQRMVRDERFKLIEYRVKGSTRYQLFDLINDPLEMHDLASDENYLNEITGLRRCMAEWQNASNDPVTAINGSHNAGHGEY
tara:strand:+ start:12246 stop:13703 length:1458 start_codon:yes stop_codon:yes gene_type:complete